jgi:rare lipoprotein A
MSIADAWRPCAAGGNVARRKLTQIAFVSMLAANFFVTANAAAKSSDTILNNEIAADAAYVGASKKAAQASSSFSNRFDCSQPSFIAEMLTSPAFDADERVAFRRAEDTLVGGASTYNPHDRRDRSAGSTRTSSGEFYDAQTWSAAIQIDFRDLFGGVRFGRNYRPSFALVESGERRVIVRINDVGPLRPGRVIDLNDQTMRYFDPTMKMGLIQDVKVTPLIGEDLAVGPVAPAAKMMAGDFEQTVPEILRDAYER